MLVGVIAQRLANRQAKHYGLPTCGDRPEVIESAVGIHLLGGLSNDELVTFVFGGGFFVLALATPFFGVRQVQEDAESYAHHFVLSGGFLAILFALTLFTSCTFGAIAIAVVPNVVWWATAHGAQRRARHKRESGDAL